MKKRSRKSSAKSCCNPSEMKHRCHPRCKGFKMFIFGALIGLNAYYMWFDNWVYFGALIAVLAFIKIVMPCCPCHKR